VSYDLNAPEQPGTTHQSYYQPRTNEFEASIRADYGACVVFHRIHHKPLTVGSDCRCDMAVALTPFYERKRLDFAK
jgi:hypothetical protein